MGRGEEREERRERERKGGEVGREREGKEEQIGAETVLYITQYSVRSTAMLKLHQQSSHAVCRYIINT